MVVEYGEVGLVQGDYAVCALRFGFRSLAVCGEPFYFSRYYVIPDFIDTGCEQCYAKNVYGI